MRTVGRLCCGLSLAIHSILRWSQNMKHRWETEQKWNSRKAKQNRNSWCVCWTMSLASTKSSEWLDATREIEMRKPCTKLISRKKNTAKPRKCRQRQCGWLCGVSRWPSSNCLSEISRKFVAAGIFSQLIYELARTSALYYCFPFKFSARIEENSNFYEKFRCVSVEAWPPQQCLHAMVLFRKSQNTFHTIFYEQLLFSANRICCMQIPIQQNVVACWFRFWHCCSWFPKQSHWKWWNAMHNERRSIEFKPKAYHSYRMWLRRFFHCVSDSNSPWLRDILHFGYF